MSLFRVTENTDIQGPHQSIQVQQGGVDVSEADAVMVMIHGRGATAAGILQLANALSTTKKLHLRAPQAANNTWYPYSFMAPSDNNEPNLSSALQKIYSIVRNLKNEGFEEKDIFLLGFSQGACLASEFIARHPQKYGGLIALSGGLVGVGDKVNAEDYNGDLQGTPVFMGCSDTDPHIPKERVDVSEQIFEKINASVIKKLYPGMGHLVNEDEIKHIDQLLNNA